MELTFWGVRGTMPVSNENMIHFGGHTPCASLVFSGDELLIVDAGTGISTLSDILLKIPGKRPSRYHILFTHFHLDHIMGFPFFAPLYLPESEILLYSLYDPEKTQRLLAGLMKGKYFPVKFEQAQSSKIFKRIPSKGLKIGGVRITHHPLHHPQNSWAFCFEQGGKKIVFATDTEHPPKGIDKKLAAFASNATILVYDSTFTPEEYRSGKEGWGHSTWLEGTKLARASGIEKLYLSHFNPGHTDKDIRRMLSLAQEEFPAAQGAKEGLLEIL